MQEAGVLAALRHPNVVSFLGVVAVSARMQASLLLPGRPGLWLLWGPQVRLPAQTPSGNAYRGRQLLPHASQVPPTIVTEYCARGSLNEVLQAARRSPAKAAELSWPRRLQMVRVLMAGGVCSAALHFAVLCAPCSDSLACPVHTSV